MRKKKEKPEWIKAGCFCPGCGGEATWVQNSEGDYYNGPTYVCLGCESRGYMWETYGAGDGLCAEVRLAAENSSP